LVTVLLGWKQAQPEPNGFSAGGGEDLAREVAPPPRANGPMAQAKGQTASGEQRRPILVREFELLHVVRVGMVAEQKGRLGKESSRAPLAHALRVSGAGSVGPVSFPPPPCGPRGAGVLFSPKGGGGGPPQTAGPRPPGGKPPGWWGWRVGGALRPFSWVAPRR